MTIVYVLVSTESDVYLEELNLSLRSLYHHNPNCKTLVLTDDITMSSFSDGRNVEKMPRLTVRAIPFGDTSLTNKQRSRWLKTRSYDFVDDGTFMFIDTDTVICEPLEFPITDDIDIAFALDYHVDLDSRTAQDRSEIVTACERIGVAEESPYRYFNSGVFACNKNESSRRFFDSWHQSWLRGKDLGFDIDQPALAHAVHSNLARCGELQPQWNCQISSGFGLPYLADAKIVHYYGYFLGQTGLTNPYRIADREYLERSKRADFAELDYRRGRNAFQRYTVIVGDRKTIALLDTQAFRLLRFLFAYKSGLFGVIDSVSSAFLRLKSFVYALRHH